MKQSLPARLHLLLRLVLLLALVNAPLRAALAKPVSAPAGQMESILERMTPEERVGQLFLVTFRGNNPSPEDPIYT